MRRCPPAFRVLVGSTGHAATLCLCMGLSAGCGGGRDVDRQSVLVMALEEGPSSWLSPLVSTAYGEALLDAVYFPLIRYDFDCGLKPRPGLASHWAWSADGKVLSMTLRDDIVFGDGVPVTARDVAFTWDLAADPKVASPYADYVARMVPGERPRILDDTHLEWHFTEAYDRAAQLEHASDLAVMPEHLLEGRDRASLAASPVARMPVPSGPWRVADYEPATRIVLEPNPAFSGPPEERPRLDRVVIKLVPDYTTRLMELENGSVDLIPAVHAKDVARLPPSVRVLETGKTHFEGVVWNLHAPALADRRVRTALARAVDVDGLIHSEFSDGEGHVTARRAIGSFPPALCALHSGDVVPIPYDPARARRELDAAGWKDTDGDGWRDRAGKRLSIDLITYENIEEEKEVAVLLQAQLAAVGVDLEIEPLAGSAADHHLFSGDFEAALVGFGISLVPEPEELWHSDVRCAKNSPGCIPRTYPFNLAGYANPEVDRLLDTPDAGPAQWRQVQKLVYADQPYLFLWWREDLVAVDRRFEDVDVGPVSFLHDLDRWREVPAATPRVLPTSGCDR